jgi:hypothetical protein
MRPSFRILLALLALSLAPGCLTQVPTQRSGEVASFDGNEQTSGIINSIPEGYVVTARFRDRYNALVAKYGNQWTPELQPDAGMRPFVPGERWVIDRQHMVAFLTLNTWSKSGRLTIP